MTSKVLPLVVLSSTFPNSLALCVNPNFTDLTKKNFQFFSMKLFWGRKVGDGTQETAGLPLLHFVFHDVFSGIKLVVRCSSCSILGSQNVAQ